MYGIPANDGDLVQLYFNDIVDSKPLSREREVELAARIQAGDIRSRDELVQANLWFVISVAAKYQNRGIPMDDLISAGNLGLITAAERFDGTKGYKFISYAVWWIRQSILQTIAEHARTVRLPLNKISLLKDIAKTTQRLSQNRESAPPLEDIAAELDLPPEEVRDALISARAVHSLDRTFEDDEETSLMHMLADTTQEAPDANIMKASARVELEEALKSLEPRELHIIRLYYGLEGNEALTLEQIGSMLNLTRERIRQLKERALGKLRHPSRHQVLKPLVEDM